jgi:hypothetical protein
VVLAYRSDHFLQSHKRSEGILQHLIIAESHHPKSLLLKPPLPLSIIGRRLVRLKMTISINFNDKLKFGEDTARALPLPV